MGGSGSGTDETETNDRATNTGHTKETHRMDLAFTSEEQAFREQVRAWVQAHLPKELSRKVHNALRLSSADLQGWAKILGQKGWLAYGCPNAFGGPGRHPGR